MIAVPMDDGGMYSYRKHRVESKLCILLLILIILICLSPANISVDAYCFTAAVFSN